MQFDMATNIERSLEHPEGTTDHAFAMTSGRHPGVRDGLQWLTYGHLPQPLQRFSKPFYRAACEMIIAIQTDSPELTTSINRLIEAKDSAVRAGIRHDTGRAGSVARPQTVVDLPKFPNPPRDGAGFIRPEDRRSGA